MASHFGKLLGVFTLLAGLSSPMVALAQDREITQVKDNLYLFRNNSHLAAFLVTNEGVIATDPINADAAHWLEAEIKDRFNTDIRYVVYSHSDADHVSGGEVWADSATIIAHANAVPFIKTGGHTALPDETFTDEKTVRLGDGEVQLHYFGPSHTDNVIVIEFPKQRAIFVVDTLNINRLPYDNLPRFYFPEMIDYIRAVEAMDFEIAIPGHGNLGAPADVTRYRTYLEALYEAASDAHKAGKPLAEAQAEISLDAYKDFENYDRWLPRNIEGIYRILDEKK